MDDVGRPRAAKIISTDTCNQTWNYRPDQSRLRKAGSVELKPTTWVFYARYHLRYISLVRSPQIGAMCTTSHIKFLWKTGAERSDRYRPLHIRYCVTLLCRAYRKSLLFPVMPEQTLAYVNRPCRDHGSAEAAYN